MSIAKDLLVFLFSFMLIMIYFLKYLDLKHKIIRQRKYFIDTLSHDLRVSTLAQIRGLDILKKELNNELLYDISDSCKYTFDMITTLLNTYKYESGEDVLKYEQFYLSKLLKKCSQDFSLLSKSKNIQICNNIESIGDINADKIEIQKVLKFLISTSVLNARKNTTINCTLRKMNNNYEIVINYDGTSLTKEEINRMFSVNSYFSTVGHGIKMNFCKKIIDFHNGKIKYSVKNNVNSFNILIPNAKTNRLLKLPLYTALQTLVS